MFRSGPITAIGLAAALLTLSAPAVAAGVVFDAGAVPNPFSPDGDGVYDECTLRYTLSESDWIVVSVEDTLGTSLAVLSSGVEDAGSHSHVWDGGAPEPDGLYNFVIESLGVPERVVVPVTIDTRAPAATTFEVVPGRFTPDGDGLADSLLVRVILDSSEPNDRLIVEALDEDHGTVAELADVTGVDSVALYWTGTDASGEVVDDGFYLIRIATFDAAGNVDEATALVDVDAGPPLLSLGSPGEDLSEVRVADTVAVITGTAFDRSSVRAVEMTLDGEEWFELSTTGDDTLAWEHTVACSSCVSGASDETLELAVRARDGAATADGLGHVNTEESDSPILSFNVVFDVAGPVLVSSSIQDEDDVYLAGQTITIKTQWDDEGYDIEADFSDADSAYDPADVEVTDVGGGVYSVEYVLSETNSLAPVYGAEVPITATDSFDRSLTDDSVAVTVLVGGGGPSGLTVDRNHFNPELGEMLAIETSDEDRGLEVEIFNMAGSLVRTLDADGGTSVEWNGRNDDGDVVASGVYFLRVMTDDGDAVRKVAVVK